MTNEVEVQNFTQIEFRRLLSWLEEMSSYLTKHFPENVCFAFSDSAFPESHLEPDYELISSGRRAFFVFGNKNQFFRLQNSSLLSDSLERVGAYGCVKYYIVSQSEEAKVFEAIKNKRLGLYMDTMALNGAFLSEILHLESPFIEIETSADATLDSQGNDWTFLKVYSTKGLPAWPRPL